MQQLSLDALRTLITIVDMGGFAKAGDILGRSQPAISLQMKKLEGQLEKKLFEKVGQRQIINSDGKVLYNYAKQMLKINDDVFRVFEQDAIEGRLRLGIPSEFATTLLPSIVGEFGKLYPNVALEVTSSLSRELLNGAQKSEFDLVLALVNPEQEVDGEVLLQDDLVWVGEHQQHIGNKGLSLVLAPSGCVYRSRVIEKLKQQPLQWRISYTNADLTGLTAAMKQGLGITALAKSSVPENLKILRHPHLPKLGTIKICLFNQASQHPQASAKLAEFIQSRLRSGY